METTKITTPFKKHEIVMKTYITGGDMRELRAIYLEVGKMSPTGQMLSDINPAKVTEAENKALELTILEIDGKPEDILQRILEMPAEDYGFILEKVNEISGFSKKK